jgi:plasmid rolling circle replication initiator protein Rep
MRGSEGGSLDKLAKPRQAPREQQEKAREVMQKRARSKWLTSAILDKLERLGSPLNYEAARSCCSTVKQEDGTLTTHYCKQRWCIVCNRIRMGRRINDYGPVFEAWNEAGDEVHLVTLTVPNCKGEILPQVLDEMRDRLKLCRKAIRRTRELRYEAVRALEVTYNGQRRDFHPHFHMAVRGREAAEAVIAEWLKRWPKASRKAQDFRPWDGSAEGLKELTKYCTKLIGVGEENAPPAHAIDTIFRALEGRHLFRPVGFHLSDYRADLDPDADPDEFDDLDAVVSAYSEADEGRLWDWDAAIGDWVDHETGECLSGWTPNEADREAVRPGRRRPPPSGPPG